MMFKLKTFSTSSARSRLLWQIPWTSHPRNPSQEHRKLTGRPSGQLQGPQGCRRAELEDINTGQPTTPCAWPPDGTSILPSACRDSLREARDKTINDAAWSLHAASLCAQSLEYAQGLPAHRAWSLHAASLCTQSLESAQGLPVYTEPGVCTRPPCTHRAWSMHTASLCT